MVYSGGPASSYVHIQSESGHTCMGTFVFQASNVVPLEIYFKVSPKIKVGNASKKKEESFVFDFCYYTSGTAEKWLVLETKPATTDEGTCSKSS